MRKKKTTFNSLLSTTNLESRKTIKPSRLIPLDSEEARALGNSYLRRSQMDTCNSQEFHPRRKRIVRPNRETLYTINTISEPQEVLGPNFEENRSIDRSVPCSVLMLPWRSPQLNSNNPNLIHGSQVRRKQNLYNSLVKRQRARRQLSFTNLNWGAV